MGIHPWTKYEIAQLRHEERVLRGLAAYQALRFREEQSAEAATVAGSGGRFRILDRLRRREAAVTRSSVRPAV
jgi:environmental stress-induced protein Ves